MALEKIRTVFQEKFGKPQWTLRSPCRVNIIGEHTDYNKGFVFPFAGNRFIYFLAKESEDNAIHIHSFNLEKSIQLPIKQHKAEKSWDRYFQSVINVLLSNNFQLGGLEILFGGDIPIGAGLSSSSSISCGFIQLLNEAFYLNLSKREVVRLASLAENSTGVQGGQMDQFTIVFGIENHAIYLDCDSFEYEHVPLNLDPYHFVLFNSNVQHNLVSTEYNQRRLECQRAFDIIRQNRKNVKEIKELSFDMLKDVETIDPIGYLRLKHFITENERVVKTKNLLCEGDLPGIGKILSESHLSLKNDYEVSCEELDYIIDETSKHKDFLGGRMMGGGFAGCTINLLRKGAEKEIFPSLAENYYQKFGKRCEMFEVNPEDGVVLL